jgi:hypothetical protein
VGVDDETECMQLHMRSVSDNGYIVNEPNSTSGQNHDNNFPREMKSFGQATTNIAPAGTSGAFDAGDLADRTESQTQLLVQYPFLIPIYSSLSCYFTVPSKVPKASYTVSLIFCRMRYFYRRVTHCSLPLVCNF